MSKKRISKRIISCFVLCALMISSIMGFAITSNAASISCRQRPDGTYVYYVDTQSSLGSVVRSVNDGDCIEFTDDIVYSGTICVRKNITIDFNHKSLRFINTSNGLYINVNKNKEVTLKNGVIYGANDSNSAVNARAGKVNFKCMDIYGGDCKHVDYSWGNGIYVGVESKIYMDDCLVMGGNGYRKKDNYDIRTGKAISCGIVVSKGKGYTAIDGECGPIRK